MNKKGDTAKKLNTKGVRTSKGAREQSGQDINIALITGAA